MLKKRIVVLVKEELPFMAGNIKNLEDASSTIPAKGPTVALSKYRVLPVAHMKRVIYEIPAAVLPKAMLLQAIAKRKKRVEHVAIVIVGTIAQASLSRSTIVVKRLVEVIQPFRGA